MNIFDVLQATDICSGAPPGEDFELSEELKRACDARDWRLNEDRARLTKWPKSVGSSSLQICFFSVFYVYAIQNISPHLNIRYIVKLRETARVEEDPSSSCKNYPYKKFSSYRWIKYVSNNNKHLAQSLRRRLPGPPLEGYSVQPRAGTWGPSFK